MRKWGTSSPILVTELFSPLRGIFRLILPQLLWAFGLGCGDVASKERDVVIDLLGICFRPLFLAQKINLLPQS